MVKNSPQKDERGPKHILEPFCGDSCITIMMLACAIRKFHFQIFLCSFFLYIDFFINLLYTTNLMNIKSHEKGNIKITLDQDERSLLRDASFRYMNTYAFTSPTNDNETVMHRDVDAFKLANRLYPSLIKANSTEGNVTIVVNENHVMSLYQIALYNEKSTLGDLAVEQNSTRFDHIRAVGNFCIELTDQVLEHFDSQNLNELLPPANR